MEPITVALLGAGARGMVYGNYILRHPGEFRLVAIAEPDEERREPLASAHGIQPQLAFGNWEGLLAQPRLAEAMIISTQDRMHFAPAMAALALGYDLLLEKPISPDPRECLTLTAEAERRQKLLLTAHVLRYAPFWATIKDLLADGHLGQVLSIQHNENIGYWHMAHSYVRGAWRREDESTPILLAKSCHDLDLLLWLTGAACTRVASFGRLSAFRPENAPLGAAARCLDKCSAEPTCPFSAKRIYLDENTDWPVSVISRDTSLAARTRAVQDGPYGRCVYACDNDVPDHQVVAMDFANGATAAFTLCGLTHELSRTIKIMGTLGEIRGHLEKNEIALHAYMDDRVTVIAPKTGPGEHAGGDHGLMRFFVQSLRRGAARDQSLARESLQSHLLAFAAEESRRTGTVVDFPAYIEKLSR